MLRRRVVQGKNIWNRAPKTVRTKLVKHVIRHPRKTIKRIRRLHRLYKKLPGFDSKFANDGKWHYKGQQHYLDEDGEGRWVGPRNTWLFRPLTAPIEKWINNNVPGLKKPKPGPKRKPGRRERAWDELGKGEPVEYRFKDEKEKE